MRTTGLLPVLALRYFAFIRCGFVGGAVGCEREGKRLEGKRVKIFLALRNVYSNRKILKFTYWLGSQLVV